MYHVEYVESCSSKLKSFSTKEEATKFIANFLLKHQNTRCQDDNWISAVYEGRLVYLEPSIDHSGE